MEDQEKTKKDNQHRNQKNWAKLLSSGTSPMGMRTLLDKLIWDLTSPQKAQGYTSNNPVGLLEACKRSKYRSMLDNQNH